MSSSYPPARSVNMDFTNSPFNDMAHIHYFEDGSIGSQQWSYPDQFELEAFGRSVQPKSFALSDFDLHLDTGLSNLPPMDRFVHGPDQLPFYSGTSRKELHISSAYDAHSPIYNRQGSPRLSERSSVGGGTLSTCHSDEYSHDHRVHMIESPEMPQQSYFFQGTYNHYTASSPELPPGGGCTLGQIQQFQDVATEFEPAHSEIDGEGESDHEEDHIFCRTAKEGIPYTPMSEDEGLGESIGDSVSVDDDEAASEYEPHTRSSPKTSRSKRQVNGRRSSHSHKQSNASTSGRVTKPKSRKTTNPNAARPFPCPLTGYGCNSTFTSKNEWKRHVSTQHIKLGYWRCDMCPPSTDPLNPSYNDFNRKDLFTQHLRRMHTNHPLSLSAAQSSPTRTFSSKQDSGLSDEVVLAHQARCYLHLRTPPPQSNCLFCQRTFSGENSWDERMEHVGAHFERERKSGVKSSTPENWNADPVLRDWLIQEGLVEHDAHTGWRIGDGRPLRSSPELLHMSSVSV